MNQQIMNQLGCNKEVDSVNANNCPICNNPIKLKEFKDRLSLKEFEISGMCQICQDKIFG